MSNMKNKMKSKNSLEANKESINASDKMQLISSKSRIDEIQGTYEEVNSSSMVMEQNMKVYAWLLLYSVLMFSLPFITFYTVHSWICEKYEMDTFQKNCYSVIASALVTNCIVAAYVYKAFNEDKPEKLKI